MWVLEPRCTVACTNIEKIDRMVFEGKTKTRCGGKLQIANMHWPWGAGMFATSLGPDDACFVAGANWHKNSGLMCVWGQVCAVQKEFIEATKTLGWHRVWWRLVVCIFILFASWSVSALFQTHLSGEKTTWLFEFIGEIIPTCSGEILLHYGILWDSLLY